MLDEMRSKHSGSAVKKKSFSSRSITKREVTDSVGVSGSSDSSSRKGEKRRRDVYSDSESSDSSSKLHKTSPIYKGAYLKYREFGTEKKVSNPLDVYEFDEYDGYVYSEVRKDVYSKFRKDANGGRNRLNSFKQSSNQVETGSGGSKATYSGLEIEDDEFDLPLSALTKKYRSSTKQDIGKNDVSKVMVNKNKQIGVSNSSKEKGEVKSLTPVVEKSSKEINEIDTVKQSNSKRVETVKKLENVKKVKEKEKEHGSGTERKISRENIKNMLLDAGWTIKYRPRKNRKYMDVNYKNPDGTVYRSIIKAYETLQKEEKATDKDSGNFTVLPFEKLGKLERQTLKKMESETKKKREDEGNSRIERKSRKLGRSPLLVRESNKVLGNDGFAPYSGKRTILNWLIDSKVVEMNEHVEYMNGRRTRVLKKGRITRNGINCGCCGKVFTVVKFEEHSGSKSCNVFDNVFLENGKSLMECQIDAWSKLGELEQKGIYGIDVDGDDPNDDTCGVCGDGGDLICCDGCPSTFHQNCLEIEMLPEGDWLCPHCSCKYCEKAEASLLTCCLCYKKYHESCRQEIDVKPNVSNSLDLSICGHECHEVYIRLKELVGVKHELDSGFSWTLIHRSNLLTDEEVSESVECNSKLAVAMSVMEECFMPFIDTRSGVNLIRNVVFNCGSNMSRLNYSGFYTAILEKEDQVVSAASIRFHGRQLAEMPFIGTRHIYRRQGMCRRLLSAIESALTALQVEKLIIPAVTEHMNTWTDVFGFHPLEESHKQEMKSLNMLVFPGTDMLQKPLMKQATKKPELISSLDVGDKNALTDSGFEESGVSIDGGNSLDMSKETLPINPHVKDENPCEPELQLPGKESDSIHSHSDSMVDGFAVQNGNGTNPKEVPEAVNHLCNNTSEVNDHSALSKNSELISSDVLEVRDNTGIADSGGVPMDDDCSLNVSKKTDINSTVKDESCGKPQLQLPGKESDSILPDSNSEVTVHDLSHDPIQLSKEAFSSVDGQIKGNNTLKVYHHSKKPKLISSNMVECNDESCCKPEVQLPGKESDSVLPHSDSGVNEVAVWNDPSHETIQLSKKESFSAVDIHIKDNKTFKVYHHSKKPKLISSNMVECNDKAAITDSGSQECGVPFDDKTSNIVQLPGKESVSIHSHSDSKADQIAVQNDNGTPDAIPSKKESFSCVDVQTDSMLLEMNRKGEEKESGILDSEVVNDLGGLHSCND